MTNSPSQAATQPGSRDVWLHVVLGILGIINLVFTASYFLGGWHDLHEQGIGHLYLVIVAAACFWWLSAVLAVCFAGNLMLSGQSDRALPRRLLYAVLGAGASIFLPTMMIAAWLLVAAWIRSLL